MRILLKQSVTAIRVLLITVTAVVSLVFIVSYQLYQSYTQTWAATKSVNRNILHTVANILENNFKTVQLSLEGTKSKLKYLQYSNNDSDAWLEANLFIDLSVYQVFGAEIVLDKLGNVVYSSSSNVKINQNFSDREYFYIHKQQDDIGLFFGQPFSSRLDNLPSMPLSIRYNNVDGSFAGVIVQTLKINEIDKLFANIELGESAGINLHLRDGTPIVLFSFKENIYNQSFIENKVFQQMILIDSGHLFGESTIDGIDRFYSFMTLKDYPIVISVVQNTKVLMRNWNSRAALALVLTLFMISTMVGLVYMMYRQIKINRQAAIQLESEKQSFKITLEAIKDAVLVVDSNGHVIYLNPSAELVIGASLRNTKGKLFYELFSIFDEQENREIKNTNIHKAIQNKRFVSAVDNRVLVNKRGDRYPIEITVSPLFIGDNLNAIVAVLHDVSNKRAQVNQMKYLAQHDALTGLPNRRYLANIGAQAISYADFNNTLVGLLFIDLDGFKNANDTLGHAGGDELLIQATNRFKSVLRTDDTLIRNGGDEFIVLVNRLIHEHDLSLLADRMISIMQKDFNVLSKKISITASIGISIYPKNADNLYELTEYADQAMYMAKKQGRNRYFFYNKNKDVSS